MINSIMELIGITITSAQRHMEVNDLIVKTTFNNIDAVSEYIKSIELFTYISNPDITGEFVTYTFEYKNNTYNMVLIGDDDNNNLELFDVTDMTTDKLISPKATEISTKFTNMISDMLAANNNILLDDISYIVSSNRKKRHT